MIRRHEMPSCAGVKLQLEDGRASGGLPMTATGDGWHELVVRDAPPGTRCRFEAGTGVAVPDPAARARIPDRGDTATFARPKLRWEERAQSPHRERLDLMRRLLALRREHITPRLVGKCRGGHGMRLEPCTAAVHLETW